MIYIYGIVSLRTGRIEWVGQTVNYIGRYHGLRCSGGKFKGIPIAMILLDTASTRRRANQLERKYFNRYRALDGCRKMFRRFRPFPEWRIRKEKKR